MKIIKPLTFNPFTFSRASTATFLNSDGQLETAGIDVLRQNYTYDIATDALFGPAPLIEPFSKNYIADSNTFEKWTVVGTPSPIVEDDYALSLDNTTNAARFTPGGLGTQSMFYPVYLPSSGVMVFSCFFKALASGTSVRMTIGATTGVFRINTDDWEALNETDCHITPYPDGWFRCEIQAMAENISISALSGASFLCYGAQYEFGSPANGYRASSYIPGDGSSVINISGNNVTRVSGEPFTSYYEGQQVYITGSPGAEYTINVITDADSMTILGGSFTATNRILYSRAQRDADVVISQTPSLVSSNIAEDDADVYDNGDTYSIGDTVMVLGEYHRVYESLTNSNTDNFPPDNTIESSETPDWLDTGATNRWRMFDMQVGAEKQSLATVSSGDIDVLMQVDVAVNSVVLLNASGSTAKVTMYDGASEVIYEREINLLGTAMGIGWWEFFFGYRGGVKTIVLTDLPLITPATIRVEIDSGGGIAGLGKLIIGEAIEIGCTKFGTTVGIIDFSRKERDAFGNNYILERRYIDKVDYDIQIDSDKVDDVKDILTDLRATPAVYIGSENKFKSTVVYGFYRDFSIVIAGSKKSSCAIQVEGI